MISHGEFSFSQIFILPTRTLPHVANMKRQMLDRLIFHQKFSSDLKKNKETMKKTRKHVCCTTLFVVVVVFRQVEWKIEIFHDFLRHLR